MVERLVTAPKGTVQAASKGEKTTQDQQKGLIPSMAAPLRWQGSVDEHRRPRREASHVQVAETRGAPASAAFALQTFKSFVANRIKVNSFEELCLKL